jgi:hypothetical protein
MKPTPLALTLLALAAPARASVLDQHNDTGITGGTSIGTIGSTVDQSAAQTIVVGITGTLDHVEMYIYADGALSSPLILQIVPVAGGLPDASTILATASITPPPTGLQWASFDFSSASLPITQGEPLALLLHSDQSLTVGQYLAEGSADQYAQGASYYRSFNGPWLIIDGYDLMFRTYVNPSTACYANCDGSTTSPVLNVGDFTCFLQKFSLGDPYANCDGSTTTPVLNVQDFTCFLQKFAQGCP